MAKKQSTQQYLDIAEIKEDVVVLKDGTMRVVLMCSSINFALKSEEEQNALIAGYMEFLNSLDSFIQVVIQSRKLDIDGYIRRLKEAQKKQTNELLKVQIYGYIDYINELVQIGEIMTKKFFIVIPFNPAGQKKKNFFARLKEAFSPGSVIKIRKDKFTKYKEELFLTVSNIQGSLKSIGLDTVLLDTQGLIELYYNSYNPKTSQNQRLGDITQLSLEQ